MAEAEVILQGWSTGSQVWLVIAPHVRFPLRNGADILVMGRWKALSRHVAAVVIVTEYCIMEYREGELRKRTEFKNRMRQGFVAAARTLVLRSHYLKEKFLTRSFSRTVENLYRTSSFTAVYASSPSVGVWAAERGLRGSGDCLWVETQNDEVKWFHDMAAARTGVFRRIVALQSKRWLLDKLVRLRTLAKFIHVAEADSAGYRRVIGPHVSITVPVGVDVGSRLPQTPPYEVGQSGMRLVFVGSLSVDMNFDALVHFGEKYWPKLMEQGASFVVTGSSPTSAIRRLCAANRWLLVGDPDDSELDAIVLKSDYSVLPFQYTNGGKLKLLKSLSLGVPILATTIMLGEFRHEPPPGCVFSDEVDDWCDACSSDRAARLSTRESLWRWCRRYSWEVLAGRMIKEMAIACASAVNRNR